MLSICSGPISSANRLSAHSSSRTPNRKDMKRLFNYLGLTEDAMPRLIEYNKVRDAINLLLKISTESQLRLQSLLNADKLVKEITQKQLEKLIKKSNKK